MRAFASAMEFSSAPTVVLMPAESDENSKESLSGTRWSSSPAVMLSSASLAESTAEITTRFNSRITSRKIAPSMTANTKATRYMYSARFRKTSLEGTIATNWYFPVPPRRS